MVRFLRSLPFALEFAIVVGLAFGLFLTTSLLVAFHLVGPLYQTSARLIRLVIFELAVMAILFPFLRLRGWSFEKIGLRPTLGDTGIGVLLLLASYAAWFAVWIATVFISRQTAMNILASRVFVQHLPVAVSLAVGLVNPFFEEVFVCGYVMTALKRRDNPWRAINASVGIRVVYHLYQGARGVLSIMPLGLIFGFWYARTGRLWPLIVAHCITDLMALFAAGYSG
jgi:CAAX protease family protein